MTILLEISNLHRNYVQGGETIPVLQGLDLSVESGATVAIIGHSGTGKSTLLSLLAGLDAADKGAITIDGMDITSMNQKALTAFRARTLSIIFQQFHLLPHLTAEENIALPLEILGRPIENRPAESLKSVELLHRAKHRPSQLSGGEKQRVAIARAFIVQPKLLLADEPSGNLDDRTGRKVMDQLFAMVQKTAMTMILVTHNQDLAKQCDQVYHLESGKLHLA